MKKLPNFAASVSYAHYIELSDEESGQIIQSIGKGDGDGWNKKHLSPAHREELKAVLKSRNDLIAQLSLVQGTPPKAWLIIRRWSREVRGLSIPIKAARALDRLGGKFGLPTQIIIEKILDYSVTLPDLAKLIEPFAEGKEPAKTPQDARKPRGRGTTTPRRAKAPMQRSAMAKRPARLRRETRIYADSKA